MLLGFGLIGAGRYRYPAKSAPFRHASTLAGLNRRLVGKADKRPAEIA